MVVLASSGWLPGHAAVIVWAVALLMIGVIWLRRHGDLRRGRAEPILGEDEPGPELDQLGRMSVLVAAKDEEANIERCVQGLLAQDYPNLQIIVIDDRSQDRTAALIDEYERRDPRFTALHVRELPPGWFGKSHAMHTGIAQADGAWLCFSDADCAYDSKRLLSAAGRLAAREKIDLLSVLPRLEAHAWWERVIQPVAGGIMVYWYPPQLVNSPRSPCAYANGAFMLMSRAAYERLGGHASVRQAVNEDMQLARAAKAAGLRLRVIQGGGLLRVRMYEDFHQAWRGWTRIFYGSLGTFKRLLGSVLLLTFISLSPYVSLALGPLLSGANRAWVMGAALFAILCQQSILWGFYRLTGTPAGYALTYPAGALFCLLATWNAMRRVLGGVAITWRGTTYADMSRTSPKHRAAD
jgi:glycosyltransferase involved in cell wall biosynthesis